MSQAGVLERIETLQLRNDIPDFRPGDTVRVHAKIVEGQKERIQVFEGIVLKRNKKNTASATFTVRKISSNIGVERTFMLHSPRIDKIEVTNRGSVRRARLFYQRDRQGKAARIKSKLFSSQDSAAAAPGNATEAMQANAAEVSEDSSQDANPETANEAAETEE